MIKAFAIGLSVTGSLVNGIVVKALDMTLAETLFMLPLMQARHLVESIELHVKNCAQNFSAISDQEIERQMQSYAEALTLEEIQLANRDETIKDIDFRSNADGSFRIEMRSVTGAQYEIDGQLSYASWISEYLSNALENAKDLSTPGALN